MGEVGELILSSINRQQIESLLCQRLVRRRHPPNFRARGFPCILPGTFQKLLDPCYVRGLVWHSYPHASHPLLSRPQVTPRRGFLPRPPDIPRGRDAL